MKENSLPFPEGTVNYSEVKQQQTAEAELRDFHAKRKAQYLADLRLIAPYADQLEQINNSTNWLETAINRFERAGISANVWQTWYFMQVNGSKTVKTVK